VYLLLAKALVYAPNGLILKDFLLESENEHYAAYAFKLNNKSIKFGITKTTTRKVRQFVTS
jgi:hypothetical protein